MKQKLIVTLLFVSLILNAQDKKETYSFTLQQAIEHAIENNYTSINAKRDIDAAKQNHNAIMTPGDYVYFDHAQGKSNQEPLSIGGYTPLDQVYWKQDPGANPGYGYSWATLTDPPGYDAYMWEVKRINMVDGNTKDPTFKATFSPVIDDEFFGGQTFDFYYENPFTWDDETVDDKDKGYYKVGDSVVIKFSKIDATVYDFLEKKYMQLGTAGNPFASPTAIPTNIQGGAIGLWAGYSPSFDTLYCVP